MLLIVNQKESFIRLKVFVTPNGGYNTQKGKGKFINRPTQTGGRSYDKFFIYLPTELARDGTFPFKEGEEVAVEIENKKLVITKIEKKKAP